MELTYEEQIIRQCLMDHVIQVGELQLISKIPSKISPFYLLDMSKCQKVPSILLEISPFYLSQTSKGLKYPQMF